MTDAEIEEMGLRLLHLFDFLFPRPVQALGQPLTEREAAAIAFVHREREQGRTASARTLAKAMGLRSSRSGFKLTKSLADKGYLN